MTNTNGTDNMLFIITVWTFIAAVDGKPSQKVIAHTLVKVGMDAMMSYLKNLDASKFHAEVAPVTTAELFAEYAEVVRNARTAGLIQGGCVRTHDGTYSIPEGATAAAASYKRIASACSALMSGCKARGRRAELESIHDRARRIMGFMSDLDASN